MAKPNLLSEFLPSMSLPQNEVYLSWDFIKNFYGKYVI